MVYYLSNVFKTGPRFKDNVTVIVDRKWFCIFIIKRNTILYCGGAAIKCENNEIRLVVVDFNHGSHDDCAFLKTFFITISLQKQFIIRIYEKIPE